MTQTLVIITDKRSTVFQTTFHELAVCAVTARAMFAKELGNADRYTVRILPTTTVESYVKDLRA
jgi:hypothetical protein